MVKTRCFLSKLRLESRNLIHQSHQSLSVSFHHTLDNPHKLTWPFTRLNKPHREFRFCLVNGERLELLSLSNGKEQRLLVAQGWCGVEGCWFV
ncbi:hypothetical protein Droror1_Dr00019194 [Drosera rotundifolia]